ncbi:hypothetical protein RO3G_11615 [Rhizopus delemar RA 99-880]|uniref:Uncharacterized protein n=1 Tax=Rhizopus delemar (strain RA 99-880 / ATCC MYA-4621 / FGSC 9543 / NRRL 43880) TaxID=246409 RepID=I1CEM4_RHIO9|nr:hypothetical protein RO3G_11615 [Rhizopus delemar RA 99-880]|eukprot:EIE86904.1 hypothetical protein RO3G_11615 [Rhizopus delemar RA 99-880]
MGFVIRSLQPILKECQKSSVPEKQELSINPNRPTTTIGRFSNYGNPVPKQYPRGIFNNNSSNHNNPATAATMTSVHKKTRLV